MKNGSSSLSSKSSPFKSPTAKIGKELNVSQETRPAALVQDKYTMVLKFNDVSVGHVPKFLSKICYFYRKPGGTIIVRITGERQYSKDLG